MTKHATSKLLMAALLAIPIFARAQVVRTPGPRCGATIGEMTTEAAKAAVNAAVDKADANALTLSRTPVEYAAVSIVVPYGAEGDAICVKDESLAGFMETLHKKTDYWKAVQNALGKERTRIQAEERDQRSSVEKIIADTRESVRLDRKIRVVESLVADVDKDIVMIKKVWAAAHDRETGSDIIVRKTEVFRQLQTLKTAK